MTKPQFVYVTYIQTTPEKVWDALSDPELTKDYWGRARNNTGNNSDWQPGSVWRHEDYDDASMLLCTGKVVESARPRRLVITWASPADAANEAKHSRVTFEIELYKDAVRLTVTHDEIDPASTTLRDISQGWPAVLSSLKTLLETGHALPMTMQPWGRRGHK